MNRTPRTLPLAAFFLLTLVITGMGCPQPQSITVLNIVGLSQSEAESTITGAGLTVGTVAEQYHDTAPEGRVLSQNPSAGTLVAQGTRINLVVSKGPEPVAVPDVVGRSLAQATDMISYAGLVSTVIKEYSDTVPVDNVISQNPVAGSSVIPGTIVELIVSRGPEPISVPDVTGTYQAHAETVLVNAGLAVGSISEQYSDTVAEGYVISQNPEAGSSVMPGTLVDLVVSLGPEPVSVPDVVGLSQGEAETTITNAGLIVGSVSEQYSDTVDEGYVIGQNPDAGTSVLPGSAVDLVVSLGPEPVPLPDLFNMSQAEAETAITDAGLTVGSITDQYSDTVAEGRVISQEPEAGSSVLPGSEVNLVLSQGSEPLPIPNVVNMTLDDAETTITNAGFTVGDITEAFSDTVEGGHIVSQDPASGNARPGSAIDLVVSKGPSVIVPDVVGETEVDAVDMIESAGLMVGTVTEAHSDDVPEGIVMAQVPEAGAEVAPETEVNLLISLGPEAGTVTTIMLPGDVPLEMVRIPAGTFMMGSHEDEQDRYEDEGPQHEVTLSSGFWMGKYTVTKGQWEAVMGTAPWLGEEDVLDDPDSPAVFVSWNDTKAFIIALNEYIEQTDQGFATMRLPSEAEWEYTARAGTTTRFYWGDDPDYTQIDDYAWYRGNTRDIGNWYAHVVGLKMPNAWGLYDMSGNVYELCEDDYHDSYVGAPADGSIWVDSPRDTTPVERGGRWVVGPRVSRSARRGSGASRDGGNRSRGFRLAQSTLDMHALTYTAESGGSIKGAEAQTVMPGSEGMPVEAIPDHGYYFVQWSDGSTENPRIDTNVQEDVHVVAEFTNGDVMTIMLPGDVPMEMVRIHAGTFMMGRYENEQDSFAPEDPQHEVVIVEGFWMGKHTITKRQWQAVMGDIPWAGQEDVLDELDSPAVYISWYDARVFIDTLNDYADETFRLPSEAEWEFAARAGTTTRFYWGDDPNYTLIDDYAWWKGNAWDVGNRYAHLVGQKLPNAFGLYDMSGNVWEWCEDDYNSDYIGAPTDGSAWVNSPRSSTRISRGGCYGRYGGHDCRSARRGDDHPDTSHGRIGFRLVL